MRIPAFRFAFNPSCILSEPEMLKFSLEPDEPDDLNFSSYSLKPFEIGQSGVRDLRLALPSHTNTNIDARQHPNPCPSPTIDVNNILDLVAADQLSLLTSCPDVLKSEEKNSSSLNTSPLSAEDVPQNVPSRHQFLNTSPSSHDSTTIDESNKENIAICPKTPRHFKDVEIKTLDNTPERSGRIQAKSGSSSSKRKYSLVSEFDNPREMIDSTDEIMSRFADRGPASQSNGPEEHEPKKMKSRHTTIDKRGKRKNSTEQVAPDMQRSGGLWEHEPIPKEVLDVYDAIQALGGWPKMNTNSWCRYCGARYASAFSRSPWGPRKLCTPHYVKVYQHRSIKIAEKGEPKWPISPSQNTELGYLTTILSKKRQIMQCD